MDESARERGSAYKIIKKVEGRELIAQTKKAASLSFSFVLFPIPFLRSCAGRESRFEAGAMCGITGI